MWRDETSYSRGRKGIDEPRIWMLWIGSINLVVHRFLCRDGWFMTCISLNIDCQSLYSTKVDDAKKEALSLLRNLLRNRRIEDAKAVDALSFIIHQGGIAND